VTRSQSQRSSNRTPILIAELDDKPYPKGTVVSDEEMQSLNIQRADFHGEWNYTIAPSVPRFKAIDS